MTTKKELRKQVTSKGGRMRTLNAADTLFDSLALLVKLAEQKQEIVDRYEALHEERKQNEDRIKDAEEATELARAQLVRAASGT